MLAVLVFGVLTQAALENDWIAMTDFQTDARCTTTHDRVSGARVTDCRNAGDAGSTDDEPCDGERLVSRQVRSVGTKEVELVECSNPNWYVEAWRAEIGSAALDDGCSLSQLLKSYTVPPTCERERVFTLKLADDRRREFRLVECSQEQFDRALEYVLAVSDALVPRRSRSSPRLRGQSMLPTCQQSVTA